MHTTETIADDLFAGAGGWDIGAAALGIHARGVEIMPEACATRAANGMETVHDDVWTYEPDGRAGLLIASPPCLTFSQAGKGSGRRALDAVIAVVRAGDYLDRARLIARGEEFGDPRTALVLAPLHYAATGTYRRLAFEQVPTVLPVWEVCAEELRARGWHVWTGMVHAEQYGVPQTRKRAVLLASLDGPVSPPRPTCSRYHSRSPERLDAGLPRWVSMAEALSWPETFTVEHQRGAGMVKRHGPRPVRSATSPAPTITGGAYRRLLIADRFGSPSGITGGPCVRPVSHPAATVTGANNYYTFTASAWNERNPDREPLVDRFVQQSDNEPDYSWPWNRPSTTVAGRDLVQAPGATANRFNGSTKSRNDGVRITLEEAATLQGFPPMQWCGETVKSQFMQVGNAVPPPMAMHLLAGFLR